MNYNVVSIESYKNFQTELEYGEMIITYSIELDGVNYIMEVTSDDR